MFFVVYFWFDCKKSVFLAYKNKKVFSSNFWCNLVRLIRFSLSLANKIIISVYIFGVIWRDPKFENSDTFACYFLNEYFYSWGNSVRFSCTHFFAWQTVFNAKVGCYLSHQFASCVVFYTVMVFIFFLFVVFKTI